MSENEKDQKQYIMDSILALTERTIKRLWILIVLLIVLLFGSNAAWIWYESQFVYEEITQEVDTGEGDAFVAGIGDIHYGESTADGEAENP